MIHTIGIDISLEVLNRDGVLQRLREDLDDLYVMSVPPTDIALDDRTFLDNPLVLIAHAGHPLAGRRRVAIEALGGERFILREPGSGTRLATDRYFEARRFAPALRMELGSNEAIKESVAAQLGVAVLSRHALRAEELARDLCVLPVAGTPIRSQWHVVHPRARRLSPIARVFHAHLLRQAGR